MVTSYFKIDTFEHIRELKQADEITECIMENGALFRAHPTGLSRSSLCVILQLCKL